MIYILRESQRLSAMFRVVVTGASATESVAVDVTMASPYEPLTRLGVSRPFLFPSKVSLPAQLEGPIA